MGPGKTYFLDSSKAADMDCRAEELAAGDHRSHPSCTYLLLHNFVCKSTRSGGKLECVEIQKLLRFCPVRRWQRYGPPYHADVSELWNHTASREYMPLSPVSPALATAPSPLPPSSSWFAPDSDPRVGFQGIATRVTGSELGNAPGSVSGASL